MIEEFGSAETNGPLEADVCIVGAGPTGLALAQAIASARPEAKIIILESGGLDVEPEAQILNDGVETAGLAFEGHASVGRARAFGGTGRLWAGQCLPLDAIDFEQRPWVPFSGWPIAGDTLQDVIARAEAFFHIRGQAYDEQIYARFGLEAPAWSAEALRTMFTVYTPRIDTGASLLDTFRRHPSIRVMLHAVAVAIETTLMANKAEAVRVVVAGGGTARVRSGLIVLCAGGLENARLLLLSRDTNPKGLGNDRGLVGRFLQDHPNGITATLAPEKVAELGYLQDRFRLLYGRGGIRYFPKFALGEATQRREGALNCNANLIFEYSEGSAQTALSAVVRALRGRRLPDSPLRRVGQIIRGAGGAAAAMARRYGRGLSPSGHPIAIHLQCHLEQAPNPESCVRLSSNAQDILGLPALCIDWRIGELERRTLQVMTNTVQQEFSRLGLGPLRKASWLHGSDSDWCAQLKDAYHHIGTTRMAVSSSTGVVDTNCQVFGVQGLFVAGGSVFPTSGYANPTLMMVALAIRLADHIAAVLASAAKHKIALEKSVTPGPASVLRPNLPSITRS